MFLLFILQKPKKICSTHLELMALAENEGRVRNGAGPYIADLHNGWDELHENTATKESRWCSNHKEFFLTESFILGVDEFSMLFFPLAFTVFNCIYWFSIRHIL